MSARTRAHMYVSVCVSLYLCVCVCLCVSVCMSLCVYIHAPASLYTHVVARCWHRQFLSCSPLYFLSLSLNLEFRILTRLAWSEGPLYLCVSTATPGVACVLMPGFSWCWGAQLGHRNCVAGTLPTEPSPQPYHVSNTSLSPSLFSLPWLC